MRMARASLPARLPAAFALLLAAAWSPAAPARHVPEQMHRISQRNIRFEILYPCDESTVFDAGAAVDVEIALSPSLAQLHGDRIQLLLDGRAIRRRKDGDFMLPPLDGGPHTLRARLVDAGGNVVRHAEPVRFYSWPEAEPAALY